MTKKEFIALADMIRLHNAGFTIAVNRFNTAQKETLADFCQSTNTAFNRERWLAYVNGECGPSGGKL